jgi:hypothetical protein
MSSEFPVPLEIDIEYGWSINGASVLDSWLDVRSPVPLKTPDTLTVKMLACTEEPIEMAAIAANTGHLHFFIALCPLRYSAKQAEIPLCVHSAIRKIVSPAEVLTRG